MRFMAQENGAAQTNNGNANNNGGNNKPHNNKRYGYNKPRYNKHHDNRENGSKNISPSTAKVNHQQDKQNYKQCAFHRCLKSLISSAT